MNRVSPSVLRAGSLLLTLMLAACGGEEAAPENPASAAAVPVAEAAARPETGPAVTVPAPPPELPAAAAPDTPAIAPAPGPIAEEAAQLPPAMAEPVGPPPASALPVAPATPNPPAQQIAPGVAPLPQLTLLEEIAHADPVAGERTAAFCTLCHTLVAGAPAGVGPNLYDIVGGPVGRDAAYAYSAALLALRAEGAAWSFDRLEAFLRDPQAAVPGTRMTAAVRNDADRFNLVAYLRTLSPSPLPVAERPGVHVPGLEPVAFTTEQVEAGRVHYTARCARCHAPTLEGDFHGSRIGFAPTLSGDRFAERWFERTVFDFYSRMESVYLTEYNGAEDHGGRSPEVYVALIAYILVANGFEAGPGSLPMERGVLERIGFWQ